jgi:hypothetical protein
MLFARLDPLPLGSDWITAIQILNSEDGSAVDLDGASATVVIRKKGNTGSEITASTTNGEIQVLASGILHVQILANRLKSLSIGEYDVGLQLSRDGYTESVIIGSLPVIDGIVG